MRVSLPEGADHAADRQESARRHQVEIAFVALGVMGFAVLAFSLILGEFGEHGLLGGHEIMLLQVLATAKAGGLDLGCPPRRRGHQARASALIHEEPGGRCSAGQARRWSA